MSTRIEISQIIAFMKLAFPNYAPDVTSSLNTVDVMMELLGDLPIDTLRAAVKACCAEPGRAFAPSAGEIRGVAVQLQAKASGMPEAAEAWGAVMAHFGQASRDLLKYYEHPLVQKAVDCMGGISAIGMSENNIADRAHFLAIYKQLQTRATSDAGELPAVSAYVESKRLVDGHIKQLTDILSAKGR